MIASPNNTNPAKPVVFFGRKKSFIDSFRNASAFSLGMVLFVLVAVTFLPTLENDFINFDDQMITSDAIMQNGLTIRGIVHVFCNEVACNWHPLTCLSHMADFELYGLRPWGHHLTSVFLHAVNALLVFLLLQRMTGAKWRSLFVAAIFGLHPLRVESVAWVAERKDVLGTMFWLLTLLFYGLFAEQSRKGGRSRQIWYGVTLGCFCLGLMVKSMLVTLPCVLLLMDYWPLNRFEQKPTKRLLMEKIPFFLLSLAASCVTFFIQKSDGAMSSPLWSVRLENALVSYCRYIGKFFWPQNLALPYPHPGLWPTEVVLAAAIFLISASIFVFLNRRSCPWLLVGWLWYLGTLVPVIGLVQVGSQAMADRYSYIPSLGIFLIVTWGIYSLTKKWRLGHLYISFLGIAAALSCIAATRQQLTYWKNSGSLFEHTIQCTKNNSVAYFNLAEYLCAQEMYDQALDPYCKSLAITPWSLDLRNDYGLLLLRLGRVDEAMVEFKVGLEISPADSQTHNNYGAALAQSGRTNQALREFEKAAQLDPSSASAHANAGIVLEKTGQNEAAIAQLERALVLQPNSTFIHAHLGDIYAGMEKFDKAADHYGQAVLLDASDAKAHYRFGQILLKINRRDAAESQFREALRLDPKFSEAERALQAQERLP